MTTMTIHVHPEKLGVVRTERELRLDDQAPIRAELHTAAGTTLVASHDSVVAAANTGHAQGSFHALEVEGPLDFTLTGLLAKLLGPLADAEVSVFTLSTYETDWILVSASERSNAVRALRAAGHSVIDTTEGDRLNHDGQTRNPEYPEATTPIGVTGPGGFRAGGVAAGIKSSGQRDLALVVNDGPRYSAAGVFTTNKVKAAPVLWSQQVLTERKLRAVVLNSGGANACTGPAGFQDTHATAEKVAETLNTGAIEVAVCSTGLIGERLPMRAVLSGVDKAVAALDDSPLAAEDAANAVLTTDTRGKHALRTHPDGWSIGGMAKGAGMLAPNLATMLAVLTTDADVDGETLDAALRRACAVTFDRLDVDGGTSTNDTVLVMASGAAESTPTLDQLTESLTAVCGDLVRELQHDAEGATKAVDITVRGAGSEDDAVRVARLVAEDNLVSTALFGSDPNWGRIAMALGRADAEIDVERAEIAVNGVVLFSGGMPAADRSETDLSGRDIEIVIDLGLADCTATVLTTDLSHGYVEENSAYSS